MMNLICFIIATLMICCGISYTNKVMSGQLETSVEQQMFWLGFMWFMAGYNLRGALVNYNHKTRVEKIYYEP